MINSQQTSELTCRAWLLPTGNFHTAIGEFELVHVIAGWQRYIPVPRSPDWCHYVFLWHGYLLPLFDMETYINSTRNNVRASFPGARDIVGVIAYENRRGETYYGGLKLSAPPAVRVVSDDEMCDYPGNYSGWNEIALSCFEHSDTGAVPILDLQKIFCAGQQ